jgi:glycosyltransferase involved in cell wall biosynthesis
VESQKNLYLFFSFGIALKDWQKLGILQREIKPYEELTKRGWKVSFITYGGEADLHILNGPIEIVPLFKNHLPKKRWSMFLLSLLWAVSHYQFFKKNSTFKSNQMFGSWLPLILGKLCGGRVVIRCGYEQYKNKLAADQNFLRLGFWYWLSKFSYHFADKIILTSKESKEFVINKFNVQSKKIEVHSNYIDHQLFTQSDRPQNGRSITVCRLDTEKNLVHLIEACHQAQLGLDIVGEGPLKTELQKLVKQIGADVAFLGKIDNDKLPQILNSYQYFFLVSLTEGNPKALLEAMSCSLVCIGSKNSGIKDIIQNEKTGFLTGFSKEEIYSTIKTIRPLDNQAIGLAAREYVIESCGLQSYLDFLEKIYVLNAS